MWVVWFLTTWSLRWLQKESWPYPEVELGSKNPPKQCMFVFTTRQGMSKRPYGRGGTAARTLGDGASGVTPLEIQLRSTFWVMVVTTGADSKPVVQSRKEAPSKYIDSSGL